jgi:hypothetical protein
MGILVKNKPIEDLTLSELIDEATEQHLKRLITADFKSFRSLVQESVELGVWWKSATIEKQLKKRRNKSNG